MTLRGKLYLVNRLGQDTYGFYVGFIIHLLQTSVCEGWNVAEIEIKCFLEKTDSARGNNASRLCALAEIYCFIGDLQKNRWWSLQLLGRKMTKHQANSTPSYMPGVCDHCGTFLSPGRKEKFPLKHPKQWVARAKMLEIFQKQFSGDDA